MVATIGKWLDKTLQNQTEEHYELNGDLKKFNLALGRTILRRRRIETSALKKCKKFGRYFPTMTALEKPDLEKGIFV